MAKRKYDYVLQTDWVDTDDIGKRRKAYKRILRKLCRDAAYRAEVYRTSDLKLPDVDRIAKELVP